MQRMSLVSTSKSLHRLANVSSAGIARPEMYCEIMVGEILSAFAIALCFMPL